MEIKEISLQSMKKPAISGFYSGNSLENFGQGKRDSLKKSISEIQTLVKEREKLSENFLREGEEIKLEISNFLIENEKTPNVSSFGQLGQNVLLEKNSLRNKKIEISELQLNEKINCWKDIALLKKEMRQYEKELYEKEARLSGINNILNEED